MIFLKALSAASSDSSAPALCAASRKRWYCAGLSGLRSGLGAISVFLSPFRGPEARASKDSHADQNTPNVAVGAIEIVGDQGAHNCKGEQSTNPQSDISQQSELPLCKWYLEAIDDLLRRKALHQIPQDEFGVVVDGAVRQVGELPLGGNNDAVRLVSVEHPLLDESLHETR